MNCSSSWWAVAGSWSTSCVAALIIRRRSLCNRHKRSLSNKHFPHMMSSATALDDHSCRSLMSGNFHISGCDRCAHVCKAILIRTLHWLPFIVDGLTLTNACLTLTHTVPLTLTRNSEMTLCLIRTGLWSPWGLLVRLYKRTDKDRETHTPLSLMTLITSHEVR